MSKQRAGTGVERVVEKWNLRKIGFFSKKLRELTVRAFDFEEFICRRISNWSLPQECLPQIKTSSTGSREGGNYYTVNLVSMNCT